MDIRQQITDEIIKAIEAGTPPWRKGWLAGVPHFNASSGQSYKGINQVILGMQPHSDPRWLTEKQAKYMGLEVRKGQRGTRIVKMLELARQQAKDATAQDGELLAEDGKKALVMVAYSVFNASQIDGIAPMPERALDVQPAEAVQAIIDGLQDEGGGRLKLNFGGNQPAYYARTDEIRIPPVSQFVSLDDFHATLLHEAVHGTGHPKRLGRLHLDTGLALAQRAREELVAEIGAALTLASIGLAPSASCMQSHAAYIASWLDALRRDKQEIFRAAAQAQKACDYLQQRALQAAPKQAVPEAAEIASPEAVLTREVTHPQRPRF